MTKINGGATLWARQTIDSDIFYDKPDVWFKIWFYIVNKVNYKDNKRYKRSTGFFQYKIIMHFTGASYDQVKHCLEYLKSAKQIATQRKTRGLLITVINYDLYQTLDNYYYEESHTKRKTKANQKPIKSHTILKNGKNVKNGKNEYIKSEGFFVENPVVYQLTIYLEGKIRENNKSIKKRTEPQIQSWCKDIDKLVRIDKASPNEVKKIIDWVVQDNFWCKNVLCPASLRKHYPRFYKEVIDQGKSLEEKIATDHRLDDVD